MSEGFTFVDWAFCGVAVAVLLIAIYTHAEGNRVSATRFVYDDIRREMGHYPRHKVWWRAFGIAMGWHSRPSMSHKHRVMPGRVRLP